MYHSSSLHDLLGWFVFSQQHSFLREDFDRKLILWAEEQIIGGNDSEPLLILASLGMDNEPDRVEVELYFSRYLAEQQISFPPLKAAALIWLKLFIRGVFMCTSMQDAERLMAFMVCHWFGHDIKFFSAATDTLKSLYWHLFDEWEGPGTSEAARMQESEFFEQVTHGLLPYYRKIDTPDWLDILSR